MARKVNPEEVVVFLDDETPPEKLPVPSTGYIFSQQGPYLETPAGELLSPVNKEPLTPEASGWVLNVLPNAAEPNKSLAAARALGLEEYYTRMSEGDKQLLESMWAMPPVKREETANAFRYIYDRKQPITTASTTATFLKNFLKRAEERGIDVREMQDPGFLGAAERAIPELVPFYADFQGLGAKANFNRIRLAAAGLNPVSDFDENSVAEAQQTKLEVQNYLDVLQQTSPDLFSRLKEGDTNITAEQVQNAVTEGTRKLYKTAELYHPAATLGTEAITTIGRDLGLSKALGKIATKPAVIAAIEALYGAGRGETPLQRLGGAIVGGFGGYAAGKLGEPLGRKAADLGVGKAPLRGGLDVLAANRAQKRIDVLLAPEKANALKTYLEDKALLKKEFEAMAAGDIEKEITTRAKEIKAYKKALEDKVITKAEFEKLAATDIEKEIATRAAAGDKAAQLYQKDVGDWQLAEAKLENVARKEFEAEQKNALREFQSTKDAEDALQTEALKLAREDLGVTEATARARQARTVALEESRGIFRKNAKIQERIDKLEARYAEAGAKMDDLEATIEGKVARYHGTELEKASRSREVAINLLDEKLARGEITEADAFAQLEQILKTSERDAEQLLKQAAEQVQAAKLGTTRPEMRAEKEVAKQKENLQNLRDTLKQKLDAQVALADKTTNTSTADPQVYQASLNRQLNDLQRVGLAVPSFDEVSARARELIDSGELAKRVPKTKQLAEIIQANRAKPAPMSYTPEAANEEIAKKLLANRERYLKENPELRKTLGKPSPVEFKRLPEWATEPPLSPEELRRRAVKKFAAEQEQYFFREPTMKAKLQSELPPAPDLSKPLPETVPPAEELQKMAAQKFETEKAEYALREPRKMTKYEAPYVEPSEKELATELYKGVTVPEVERARSGMSVGLPGLPARGYVAETKPPLSSVDISPYTKYTKAAQARDIAQEAMATPIAVPVAQSLSRLGMREGVPAAKESFIDYLRRQQAEDEAANRENAVVSKKIRQALEALLPAQ